MVVRTRVRKKVKEEAVVEETLGIKGIVIADKYSFQKDTHGWKLHKWSTGEDKDGNLKLNCATSYHTNIEQIGFAIINKEAGGCKSVGGVDGHVTRCN